MIVFHLRSHDLFYWVRMLSIPFHLQHLEKSVTGRFPPSPASHGRTNTKHQFFRLPLLLLLGSGLLLLLGLLEHLLDDLLLLDQEGTDDAVLDAVAAARATVGTVDGLLGAGDLGVFTGAEGRNLIKINIISHRIFFQTCNPPDPAQTCPSK